MRIDGENIAAAQVERVILRHPDVVLAAVFAVPDPVVGDQVMAALQLREGSLFDPEELWQFLERQSDVGTKWKPRFLRICKQLPVTQTKKVLKRQLRQERWDTSDPVWWQRERGAPYGLMTEVDVRTLNAEFARRGRGDVLNVT
jgi:fatty-acyl-CoA synthase